MSGPPIRVLIVDDDYYVRDSLAEHLAQAPGILVAGTCSDGREALAVAGSHQPDVILMDIRMPVLDGIEATRAIHSIAPATRILALTTFDDDRSMARFFDAGGSGYLLKDTRPQPLADAIRAAHSGITVVPPDTLKRWGSPHLQLGIDNLTPRERAVLDLIAVGLTNSQVGERLFLSTSTVKTMVNSIKQKVNVRDRAGLIAFGKEVAPESRSE